MKVRAAGGSDGCEGHSVVSRRQNCVVAVSRADGQSDTGRAGLHGWARTMTGSIRLRLATDRCAAWDRAGRWLGRSDIGLSCSLQIATGIRLQRTRHGPMASTRAPGGDGCLWRVLAGEAACLGAASPFQLPLQSGAQHALDLLSWQLAGIRASSCDAQASVGQCRAVRPSGY